MLSCFLVRYKVSDSPMLDEKSRSSIHQLNIYIHTYIHTYIHDNASLADVNLPERMEPNLIALENAFQLFPDRFLLTISNQTTMNSPNLQGICILQILERQRERGKEIRQQLVVSISIIEPAHTNELLIFCIPKKIQIAPLVLCQGNTNRLLEGIFKKSDIFLCMYVCMYVYTVCMYVT